MTRLFNLQCAEFFKHIARRPEGDVYPRSTGAGEVSPLGG